MNHDPVLIAVGLVVYNHQVIALNRADHAVIAIIAKDIA